MHRRLGSLTLAAAVLAAAARPAAADDILEGDDTDEGREIGGTTAACYGLATVFFAFHDIAIHKPSPAYGFVETSFNTPLALVWGEAFVGALRADDTSRHTRLVLGTFTAIHTVLAVNGVRAMLRNRNRPAPRGPGQLTVGSVRADLAPTVVSDGRSLGAGLGLAGAF